MMTRPQEQEQAPTSFAVDVRQGLGKTPKTLPARYFYDGLGSQLFEAICELPWYPITRAELRLLERFAPAMARGVPNLSDLIELGSGSGEKIALLAQPLSGGGAPPRADGGLHIHLIDISEKALELSRSNLRRLRDVTVHCHAATYEEGLRSIAAAPSRRGARLVLFLGSNIGNFELPAAHALLTEIRRTLRPGDGLLLGTDLVRPEAELLLAYDDPLGVTAAFNKNLLVRMNAELGADFELDAWKHRAIWNAAESRIEMHLVSRRPQRASIPGAGLSVSFAEGETIWTESSYKYTEKGVIELGRKAGFRCKEQWIEPAARFSTTLFLAGDA